MQGEGPGKGRPGRTVLRIRLIYEKESPVYLCSQQRAEPDGGGALNKICRRIFQAHSAGLEPGTLNPLAVEVLQEIGIDISQNKTQAVFDVFKAGQLFPFVITVCSETEAAGCPIFPGVTTRLHWPFPDPSKLSGNGKRNSKERAKF